MQICRTLSQFWQESGNPWDLYLVDLGLPDGTAWAALEHLKEITDRPVMIMTGSSSQDEIDRGFDLGVDDYLIKPVSLGVLRAKIRRFREQLKPASLPVRDQWILEGLHLRHRSTEQDILLTPMEAAILICLVHHPVAARHILIQVVFGATGYSVSDNSLSIRISSLRKKLEPAGLAVKSVRFEGVSLVDKT